MDRNRKEALAMRVSVVTILGNLALTIFKLAAGVLAHSGAMISDVRNRIRNTPSDMNGLNVWQRSCSR